MAFNLIYLGHSGFEFDFNGYSIMIDPFLSINQDYDYREKNITDIFLTHAHADHLGNAIDIANAKRSTITAVFELANFCNDKGATRSIGINLGSWLNYDWGRAIFVPAKHSSSNINGEYMGEPAGVVFDIAGIKIYHAGDTALFSDIKLIKELYNPDVVMLPIGGTFTMDIEHAAIAAEWLDAKITIPIHYNTFSSIDVDVHQFEMLLQTKGLNCQIMNMNDEILF
ncbi:MAG: metal-dependent hydrolase [Candidatus Gastranaerophilaceae bacterium]